MATVMYPYDDTGRAATNLVQNEIQVLTASNSDPYRYCIPTFAPFYETNFSATGFDALGSERPLVSGVDYNFNLIYIGATRANGAVVWGGITVINNQLQGTIKITYQCLGGKYSADRDYVVQQIAENNYNPRVVAWDQITNIQELFPPSNHPMDLDYFTGYRDLIDAINKLQDAPGDDDTLRDLIWKHILDHNDPHETLKLLGEYAKKTDVTEALLPVNNRIDNTNRQVEINTNDIAALKNGIDDDGALFQTQIDNLKADVRRLDTRIDGVQGDVAATNLRVDNLSSDVSGFSSRIIAAEQAATQATMAVTTLTSQVDALTLDTETRLTAIESVIGFTANVPDTKTSEMLLVAQPQFRFMVWSQTDDAYIRAPWHQPGMLVYSYTNPGNGITGYLPVRGDITYNQEIYPDLVKLLGLSGTGTFTLVEMRGEFLRILDNGRGVDVNRQLLSWKNTTVPIHAHTTAISVDEIQGTFNICSTTDAATGKPSLQGTGLSATDIGVSTGEVKVSSEITSASVVVQNTGIEDGAPRNIAVPIWLSI